MDNFQCTCDLSFTEKSQFNVLFITKYKSMIECCDCGDRQIIDIEAPEELITQNDDFPLHLLF